MELRFLYENFVRVFTPLVFLSLIAANAYAQDQSLLSDVNGDGQVRILAFGDSITYGVGDNTAPGLEVQISQRTDGKDGYPARLERYAGVPVDNRGVPGEQLINIGVDRVPSLVSSSSDDIVVLFEGANDAFNHASGGEFGGALQRAINVTKLFGKVPVLVTLYPTCCDHALEDAYIAGINDAVRDLSSANNLAVADLNHAWVTTCDSLPNCYLLNLPEGLHPNTKGYDVIAQTILATLSGIDIFAMDGAANLEAAFHLTPGTVIVKPDPVSKG